jgi:allantoin racemase
MRLLLVNPNTTASMTAKVAAAARAVARPGTSILACNPPDGPASIEGWYDEAFSVPGLLVEIRKAEASPEPPDAVIVACFDDTGLEAARTVATGPVLGIGEAAFHAASFVAHRFSVVTTLARSVAAIEMNLLKYGLDRRCTRVRACEVPVLALESPGSDARARISAEIGRALAEDGAEAIVLGCAGMADLAKDLGAEHDIPVIDGVAAAVAFCEGLVALGLRTSRRGSYAPPIPKAWSGRFAGDVP